MTVSTICGGVVLFGWLQAIMTGLGMQISISWSKKYLAMAVNWAVGLSISVPIMINIGKSL